MKVSPVSIDEASDEIKSNYLKIIKCLELTYLPLFFQYFGSFPEYLDYITNQIVTNIKSEKFNLLVKEAALEVKKLIQEEFPKTQTMNEYLNHYQTTPQFYNFRNVLEKIFITNFKLTLIFLALRETIKGWAIGAKKLPSSTQKPSLKEEEDFLKKTETVIINEARSDILNHFPSSSIILKSNFENDLPQKNNSNTLTTNFFVRYLEICQKEFFLLTKEEKYFLFRVQIEKLLLNSLPLMPEIIFSPINKTLPLIAHYDNYPDFLYLLYEYFPPLSIKKLIFSSYILL